MATKIAPFTLRDPDLCVKCGVTMPSGTVATWLREPERKGYYHPACEAKPTNEQLVRVRVPDDSPMKYSWIRVSDINSKPVDTEKLSTGPKMESGVVPPGADGILLQALTAALLPSLTAQIAAAVANNQPRIVVNVYCPRPGDEVRALSALSTELFLLQEVKTI